MCRKEVGKNLGVSFGLMIELKENRREQAAEVIPFVVPEVEIKESE
jgi:hypothetical protein